MNKACLTVVFSLLGPFTLTYANDTAFGGAGASPMPIQQNQVKMVSENIIIEGEGLNDHSQQGKWKYACQFTFKNTSNQPQAFIMGFPLPLFEDEGDVALPSGKKASRGSPLVYDFTMTINNTPMNAKLSDISTTQKMGMNYKKAYLWPMKFTPMQTVIIKHNYITGVTFDVLGLSWVHYVLQTGSLWKGGIIGHTHIEVHPNAPTKLCSEVVKPTSSYMSPSPDGMKIKTTGKIRSYIWDLKNFHPTKDLSLCLQTGQNYVRYQLVYKILNQNQSNQNWLQQYSKQQLRLLKNTIYAQYGRRFHDKQLQQYFNRQWWYQVNPNYSDSLLEPEDKKALAIILKISKKQN